MSDEQLTPEMKKALDQLDARAQAAANRLDVGRVSARVLGRLKDEPHERTGAQAHRNWMRAAAAIALVVGGTATAVIVSGKPGTSVAGLPVNIDSLTASDSQAVMLAMDEVRVSSDSATSVSAVTVDDLSEQELRALLQALENEEAL